MSGAGGVGAGDGLGVRRELDHAGDGLRGGADRGPQRGCVGEREEASAEGCGGDGGNGREVGVERLGIGREPGLQLERSDGSDVVGAGVRLGLGGDLDDPGDGLGGRRPAATDLSLDLVDGRDQAGLVGGRQTGDVAGTRTADERADGLELGPDAGERRVELGDQGHGFRLRPVRSRTGSSGRQWAR
jgi:hypothetical protein